MALKIKRWSLDKTAGLLFESLQGKFVRFTEHAAEVVRLEAHIAELEVLLSQARPSGGHHGGSLTASDLGKAEGGN